MNKELLEKMAERVHIGWMNEKQKQGFHHPSKCPERENSGISCVKCHESLKSYNELTESMKELDRVMIKEYEENLNKEGYYIEKR